MNIMILGHKGHGKTTLAQLLDFRFGFAYVDTTHRVKEITKEYLKTNPIYSMDTNNWKNIDSQNFDVLYEDSKDTVREQMKAALRQYTKNDPARLIKEQFSRCNIYAGCRSNIEYQAAKDLIDFTFWIRDTRQEENDPTMDIPYDSSMILIDNSSTKLQLEYNIKKSLHELGGIPIRSYDKTLRDSIISGLGSKPSLSSIN